MCRIAVIQGKDHEGICNSIKSQFANAATQKPEMLHIGDVSFLFSRFGVTSEHLQNGQFPLENERYALFYNGEVYGFMGQPYVETDFTSDVHFALSIIEEHGIDAFFKHADLQGTFVLFDKTKQETHVFVDQLNTAGCFYAEHESTIIIAQEYPVIDRILKQRGAIADHPINIVPNGSALVLSSEGMRTEAYRNQYQTVWRGEQEIHNENDMWKHAKRLNVIISKAVRDRIPKTGPVAVLCSGGVDSSLILHHVIDHLRSVGQMDRLKIYTLGCDDLADAESDDLKNVRYLLKHLQLDEDRYLVQVEMNEEWFRYLMRGYVFNESARLITPNPAQTQIRHTVQMSCVLAQVLLDNPMTDVVMTGDFADEIFAGYNSMHYGLGDPVVLTDRIKDKLSDLPLNDAARVILASMSGCRRIISEFVVKSFLRDHGAGHLTDGLDRMSREELREMLDDMGVSKSEYEPVLAYYTPIEVRSPFSSHHVLDHLCNLNHDALVGEIDGRFYSKLLLRLSAMQAGLPKDIFLRKKIPFNEGGTGIKNDTRFDVELDEAQQAYSHVQIDEYISDYHADINRLGLDEDRSFERLCFLMAANQSGLSRLLNGNAFRESMPDSNYSTNGEIDCRFNAF